MVLISILAIVLISLTLLTILAVSAVGTVGIVVFGDVIVCIVFIALLIKFLVKRKNKN